MTFTEKNIESLKIAMVRKYGNVNYSRLAKDLNISRISIYNAIKNKPYCDNIKKMLKEWLIDNA